MCYMTKIPHSHPARFVHPLGAPCCPHRFGWKNTLSNRVASCRTRGHITDFPYKSRFRKTAPPLDVSRKFRFSFFSRSHVVLCWNSSRCGKRPIKSASMMPGLVAVVALTFIFVRDTTGFVVVLNRGCALTTSKDDPSTGLLQIKRVRHSGLMRWRFLAAHNKDLPNTTQTSPTINEDKSQTSSLGGPEKTTNVTTSLFEELLRKCTEATSSDGATESPHTGSSEWAGFRTKPHLLEVHMTSC